MYNWSVDIKKLKKNHKKYSIFKLEQAINFGLNGEKLSISELKKNLNILNIDPSKKEYLNSLVCPK